MGILLSTPEKVTYVRILLPKDLKDAAIASLQEAGLIHIEPLGRIPEEDKKALYNEKALIQELDNIIGTLESFYEMPKHVELKAEVNLTTLPKTIRDLLNELKKNYSTLSTLLNNRERLNEELSTVRKQLKHISYLMPTMKDYLLSDLSYEGRMIYSMTLIGKRAIFPSFLKSLPPDIKILAEGKAGEDEIIAVIVGINPSKERVLQLLPKFKIEVVKLPSLAKPLKDFYKELREKEEHLSKELERVEEELNHLLNIAAPDVALAKALGKIYRDRIYALLNALAGNYLIGIEGWVPEPDMPVLEDTLSHITSTYFISQVRSNKEPPTKLKNKKPVKPFELITKLYGVPSYKEWDPTPIIMYSFMVFFGTMFADAIYGILTFILIKYVLERTGLVDDPYSEGYQTLKKLLLTLSISSAVFGALSNTFAGFSIVKTASGWTFAPAGKNAFVPSLLAFTDPIWFLKYALVVGLLHINVSHAISFVRGVKERDLGRTITEAGIFIGEVFGIPYILHSILHYDLFPMNSGLASMFLYGSILGLLLIIGGTIKSSG
jgi:V/A-type H+-transporting ATPase subunit I